ncbi:MAG: 50S ribosomal protein L23 [Gammaproteobacteria bacterium]|nr:MAG: 50S ribosomal protein L23 [Gammaproteobacteria bacterium]
MNDERLFQVLLAPVISEKATRLADKNGQYVFRVEEMATKPMIKKAVERMFSVKVESVQVLNVRGKMKYGKHAGKRRNWKKAFVRLQSGQDIDFMGVQ